MPPGSESDQVKRYTQRGVLYFVWTRALWCSSPRLRALLIPLLYSSYALFTFQTVALGESTDSDHLAACNAMGAHGLDLLAQMAAAGGRTANATRFAAESAALKAAIVTHMWNGSAFCDGVCADVRGASKLMTNMFLLAFGMVPTANIPSAWGVVAVRDDENLRV